MTWSVLQSTERQLDDLNIPTFGNGKRVMVLHPRQVEQLTLDPTYQRLARYERDINPLFNGTYVSSVGNWDIFKSTTLTTATASPSNVTVYYGQAFGPGGIGAGIGDMPRVAYNSQDNYGETALVIWLMYSGFEVLDSRFIARITTS
jgi:N4-gp56 family major capsid protein